MIENTLAGDVVYLNYQRSGAHNRELIDAFGIPEPARTELHRQVSNSPRLNSRPSQKQATVFVNVDELSRVIGVELDPSALRTAYLWGNLKFDDDQPCDLVDADLRQATHEAALDAARNEAIHPYIDFFADTEVTNRPPVQLDPKILTEDDRRLIVAACKPGDQSPASNGRQSP